MRQLWTNAEWTLSGPRIWSTWPTRYVYVASGSRLSILRVSQPAQLSTPPAGLALT
jgi:hypothetical protein